MNLLKKLIAYFTSRFKQKCPKCGSRNVEFVNEIFVKNIEITKCYPKTIHPLLKDTVYERINRNGVDCYKQKVDVYKRYYVCNECNNGVKK